MTTTTENPMTGNTAGSQRLAEATDTPWWKVRHSLAAGFVATVAAAGALYYFAGIVPKGLDLNLRSLASVLTLLSATPSLVAIGLTACLLMANRTQRRPLKLLCGLLALASLAGAGLNVARQAYGHRAIDGWIERAVPAASAQP
jgi:hypothetical protein